MGRIIRRVLFLFVVFVLGVAGTALLLNQEATDNRSDMNDPTLPEVMVQMGDTYVNRMFGYTERMQVDFSRDSLTPLDTSKELTLVVNPYESRVDSLSYEVRTSDGSKVIENRKIKNLETVEAYQKAKIQITSDLLMNQEYSLQISLETNVGTVYYYTRIISRSVLYTEQYAKFVNTFAEKCLNMSTAEDLAAYLESDSNGNATNYSNIDITSALSEISWGSLSPSMIMKGVPTLKDINETTASFTMMYVLAFKTEGGNTERFLVSEFYRMRYTDTRIMLLDFTRSAQQVFNPRSSVITEQGLVLGVRDKNVSYMMNEDVSVIAFVQQGDLWTYAPDDGKIARVFSFRRTEGSDIRDFRTEHDIKIIRVEENGDVDFVLSGYMSRGEHEGRCGICVYHYNSDMNVVDEKVFIPTTESNEFLQQDLGTLSYVNAENQLFLLFAGNLYQININEGTYEIMESSITMDRFVVSDSNAHAAWLIQEGEDAGKLKEISFDTRESVLLSPEEGSELRPLGYLNEDLVYGILNQEDIVTDSEGRVTEGIHTFYIKDFAGNVKKEYHKDNLYVTNVTISGTMMEFQLSRKSGSRYIADRKDNILNNRKAAENAVSLEMTSVSGSGVVVRLALEDRPDVREALVVYAKFLNQEPEEIALDTPESEDEIYYVYGNGRLDGRYKNPGEAILRADEIRGVVLNREQQYIWERGNKKTQIQLNVEDIPYSIRTGPWDLQLLAENLGETATIMDLSGCSLEQVLYEVSAQRAVVAKTENDTYVVIVGYDEYNTYLLDPSTGETYPYGMNDSTELFEKAGNLFFSYVENVQQAAP